MRTETDPTENAKDWKPFGEKVEPSKPKEPTEWQPSPDAPGVEINWKTGMRRTNLKTPNAWVEDLAMQEKDAPKIGFKATAFGLYDERVQRYTENLVEMVGQMIQARISFPNGVINGKPVIEWAPIKMTVDKPE